MKRASIVLLCAVGLLTYGCSGEERMAQHHSSVETTSMPLSWSVMPVEGMKGHTRALMDNDKLQEACTATAGEGVGIWGDYELNTNTGKKTIEGFLDNVKLMYHDPDGDSPTGWDYGADTEDQHWVLGGIYKFRAYFPQTKMQEQLIASSNATTFVVNYNTTKMQEDLLVAYQSINTMQWDLTKPVPLKLRHALAAIQFKFQFEKGLYETDYLTSCWLQNTAARDFTSVGMLAYGVEDPNEGNKYNPNWIDWHESYNSPATERMYYWESDGIELTNSQTEADPDDDKTEKVATAYTDKSLTTDGSEFINNDGYVLIIPQPSEGTVQLCFTTYEGGETVYRVAIPRITGTSQATQRENNTYKDKDGNTVPEYCDNGSIELGDARNAEGTDFVAGYRYTYMVTISKTNLNVSLSIAPWNELKSSFDISF